MKRSTDDAPADNAFAMPKSATVADDPDNSLRDKHARHSAAAQFTLHGVRVAERGLQFVS